MNTLDGLPAPELEIPPMGVRRLFAASLLVLAACAEAPRDVVARDGASDTGVAVASDAAIEDALALDALDVFDATSPDAGDDDSGITDGGVDTSTNALACASVFGNSLTPAFGRLDGTLVAVVSPSDTQCIGFTDDHLVIEIAAQGGVYRIYVNVEGDGRNGTDPEVRHLALPHPLVGGPFAEGWHTGVRLDYPTTLGARSSVGFVPETMSDLIKKVDDRLVVGAPISAYATSELFTDSAHLVHKNAPGGYQDGALVVGPRSSAPMFLLFHFDGVTF